LFAAFFSAKGLIRVRDALLRLLEPKIESLGFEVTEIEFVQAGRGGTLRVFIDRAVADSARGITVDDCAAVSRAVGEVLEAEDPIEGRYTLEVSSPGSDRILRKKAHFERFVGERISVELKLPIDGRRRFAGPLKTVQGDSIVVEVDGRLHELKLERIQKARLKPE